MELFKTYHTCRFSTLTINFSKVWSTQILELGKQFNLMIHLQNILKASLQDVLKMSWRRFCRRLEDVLKTFLQGRRLGKTSWRRLENILKTYGQDEYIGLDQDVLKTSSEDVRLRRTYSSWSRRLLKTKDVFKTSSSRRMFAGQFSPVSIVKSVLTRIVSCIFFMHWK